MVRMAALCRANRAKAHATRELQKLSSLGRGHHLLFDLPHRSPNKRPNLLGRSHFVQVNLLISLFVDCLDVSVTYPHLEPPGRLMEPHGASQTQSLTDAYNIYIYIERDWVGVIGLGAPMSVNPPKAISSA